MSALVDIKKRLVSLYINSLGWRTKRKLVVIESDDWGSIRMPSKEVYNKFLEMGFPVNKLSYLKYDSLESNTDLEALFDVLSKFKDKSGNHPVFTANTIMTNPDFSKIEQSGYNEYHSELFTETLKKYPEHNKVPELYKQGIASHIFQPQLHGREHLNVSRWMKAIQVKKSNARLAFNSQFYDLSTSHTEITADSFADPFSLETFEELSQHKQSIKDATIMFSQVFGYTASSFIAPVYIWRPEIEQTLYNNGIMYIQGNVYQKIPVIGKINSYSKRMHYTGETNKFKQVYTTRNSSFEPSSNDASSEVNKCMNQVERSFKYQKPAIICTHRLNYIGFINEKNRKDNLLLLKELLVTILNKWPEVEFITSEKLGEIINHSKSDKL